jgi:hypothetical protein
VRQVKLWRGLAKWNTGFLPYFGRDILPICCARATRKTVDKNRFPAAIRMTPASGNYDFTNCQAAVRRRTGSGS